MRARQPPETINAVATETPEAGPEAHPPPSDAVATEPTAETEVVKRKREHQDDVYKAMADIMGMSMFVERSIVFTFTLCLHPHAHSFSIFFVGSLCVFLFRLSPVPSHRMGRGVATPT